MTMPPELEPWVWKDGDNETRVVHPCYVDYRFVKEVGLWHPTNLEQKGYVFKHVAREENGKWYAVADSPSADWSADMVKILLALRLSAVKDEEGTACLVDDAIGSIATPTLAGWKVVRWKVVKGQGSKNEPVHHDFVTWKKGSVELQSMFSWIPYR